MKRGQIETTNRRNPKRKKRGETGPIPTTMGLFEKVPEEITQHLLSEYMPLSALSRLSVTSKTMCTYIRELSIDTQLLIRPINNWITEKRHAQIKNRFIEIGMLLRTTSVFLNIKEKLNVIEVFLYELEDTYHRICEKLSLRFAYDCIGLMIYKFILDWDDNSLQCTFVLINRLSRLKERIDKVISNCKQGTLRHYERDVRQFVQEVFLKKAVSPDQRSLWLSFLMDMYPTQHARLLYLLYGPLQTVDGECTGMIDWDMLIQCATYGHISCSYSNFKELADSINLIASSNRFRWSDITMIRFFTELTSTPEPWCLENSAKLMFLLGHNMSVKILQNRLKADRIQEFSHIAYHLAQVSSQNSPEVAPESLSWFIKVMFDSINILPAPSRKSHVITEIFKAWKENITALIEEVEDPIDDDHEDVREEMRSTAVNLASVAHLLMDIILNDKESSSCYSFISSPTLRNEE